MTPRGTPGAYVAPAGLAAGYEHTAVWSGAEMIVWGGRGTLSYLSSGSRYDPSDDAWVSVRMGGAPDARDRHTVVWTGAEAIVWGGAGIGGNFATGGRFDPVTGSWSATALTGAPEARTEHQAVWTGVEMIVWGGRAATFLSSGGRYDPASDTWSATSVTGAPAGRYRHTAVWSGNDMIATQRKKNSSFRAVAFIRSTVSICAPVLTVRPRAGLPDFQAEIMPLIGRLK